MESSSSLQPIDLTVTVEPDLQPLYPTTAQVAQLLSPSVGLSPTQKQELVSHCLIRACIFGDFALLSFLLIDPQAQVFIDLGKQDEDGLGLISITILGFGSDSDRDVEREECVRLLISEGADVNLPDYAGWISLHHAALIAPPTLVSYLLTHGCSPFAVTRRKLTALDIVTASTTLPGREDVALLLEEHMRAQGWTGGRMEERRKLTELRQHRMGKRRDLQEGVEKALNIDPRWWGEAEPDYVASEISDDEDEDFNADKDVLTPPPDYTTMLVFSLDALPDIFQTLITDFRPSLRNCEPANALYMLARFAILNCDQNWVEDLIIGATDTIEDTFFSRSEDLPTLVFWLYNLTVWLHLMRCDDAIRETCEALDTFTLIEEVLNSVFVFIIRIAERKIDTLLDAAMLEYSPLSTEFESVQFESEWSFLRSFGAGKKKASPSPLPIPPSGSSKALTPSSPPRASSRPPSPPPSSSVASGFASLKQTFTRSHRPSISTPLQSLFDDTTSTPSPKNITSFISALHTLLTVSDINPAIITQFWSQVMYWTACETFNRILTRKKYLCRSRAVQINMNLSVLEEWIGKMGLPRGIGSHFAPVRDLLNWLQCLSSITEFPNLIATIQTMRNLNPLQMRRAVRDYKYEVNEGRMTEECIQYLAQLQKDWERHRVKVGVEALRKEIGERDRERDVSPPPDVSGSPSPSGIMVPPPEVVAAQRNIDALFDRGQEKSAWEPAKAPDALGELLDSRQMLPLLLPSNPRYLAAIPGRPSTTEEEKRRSLPTDDIRRSASRASFGSSGSLPWRMNSKKLRDVGAGTLRWVDGHKSAARWFRPRFEDERDDEDESAPPPPYTSSEAQEGEENNAELTTHLTLLTRKSSLRSRGRASMGGDDINSPIDEI